MGDSFPDTVALPALRYRLGTEPQSQSVIKTYSNTKIIQVVRKLLGFEEFKKIENSFLGPVIRASQKNMEFSKDLVHHLLKRSIISADKDELWFHLGGQPMRFSLREFHMVTGLKCFGEDSEEIYNCEQVSRSHNLKDLEEQIKKTRNADERYLLGMLMILEGVFLAKNGCQTFPTKYIEHAQTVELLLEYKWGKESYQLLKESIDEAVQGKLNFSSYELHGFPMAIYLWALSSVPLLQKKFRSFSIFDKGFLCERFFKTESGSLALIHLVEQSEELMVTCILPSLDDDVENTSSSTESSDPDISSMVELIQQGYRVTYEDWITGAIDTYAALDKISTQLRPRSEPEFDKKAIIDIIDSLGTGFNQQLLILLQRVSSLEEKMSFVCNSSKRANEDPPSNEKPFQSPQDFTIPNNSPNLFTSHKRAEVDCGESSKQSVTEVLEMEPVVDLDSTYNCSTTLVLGNSNPSSTNDENRLSQNQTPTSQYETIPDTKSQKRPVNEICKLLFRKPLVHASAPEPNEKQLPEDVWSSSHARPVVAETTVAATQLPEDVPSSSHAGPVVAATQLPEDVPSSSHAPPVVAATTSKKEISPPTFDLQLFFTPPEEMGESSNMQLDEDKKKKHAEDLPECDFTKTFPKHREMEESSNMELEENKKKKHAEDVVIDKMVPLKKRKHNQILLPSPPQVFLRRSKRTITMSNHLTNPFEASRNPALEKTPEVHAVFHPFISPELITTEKLSKWKESKRRPTIKIFNKTVDPSWFIQLETPETHITPLHIDATLMLLKSRRKSDPAYFHNNRLPKAIFLSTKYLQEVYKGYATFKRNPEHYVFREELIAELRDVEGEPEVVYSAIFSNHWMGLCIDLKTREITVFECDLEGSKWGTNPTNLLCLSEMLPYLFSKVPEWTINDVSQYIVIKLESNIPTTRHLCNCSIYALKMMECHSMGIKDMRRISDNYEEDMRTMLAVGIFEEVAERC